jgi:MFS family permease
MKSNGKISRNVKALGITSLLNDISSEIIYPLLPVFLNSYLGIGVTFIGFIEGLAESSSSILKLISGKLSDKIGKNKLLTITGYTVSSLVRPLIALSTLGWHVVICRFFDRVGKGIRTSPRDVLIAESTPPEMHGRAFGFHRSLDNLGAVIGPLIAFGLLPILNNDLRQLFLFSSIPGIFIILLLIFGVKETHKHTKSNDNQKLDIKLFDKNFKFFLGSLALFTLGNSSDAFLLLKAKSTGISVNFLPVLWVIFHLVKFGSSYPLGIISDSVGRKRMIVSGWIIYFLVYIGFAFAMNEWQIWGLFIIYGLYYGFTEGIEKAFVMEIIPKDKKGTAFGFYNFTIGLCALPASLIFGFFYDYSGAKTAFLISSALSLLSIFILTFFVKKHR